MSKFNATSL